MYLLHLSNKINMIGDTNNILSNKPLFLMER